MKFSILSLAALLLVACGAKGGSGSGSTKNGQSTEPVSSCSIAFKRSDSPAMVARKAFQLQAECGIETEEALLRKIKKYDR